MGLGVAVQEMRVLEWFGLLIKSLSGPAADEVSGGGCGTLWKAGGFTVGW